MTFPKVLQANRGTVMLQVRNKDGTPWFGPNSAVIYEKATLQENINCWSELTLYLKGSDTAFIARNVITDAEVSVTIIQEGDVSYCRKAQTFIIVGYEHIPSAIEAGSKAKVVLRDNLWKLHRNDRIKPHIGTIGELVEKIAKNHSIDAALVQNTSGRTLVLQSGLSDYELLRDRLVWRAYNQDLKSDYRFYLMDDKLWFHSPAHAVHSIFDLSPFSTSAYVHQPHITNYSPEAIANGADGVTTVAYNPVTGTLFSEGASNYTVINSTHVTSETLIDQMAITLYRSQVMSRNRHLFKCLLVNTPYVRLNDSVNLNLNGAVALDETGLYVVDGVFHLFANASSSTTLNLCRFLGTDADAQQALQRAASLSTSDVTVQGGKVLSASNPAA